MSKKLYKQWQAKRSERTQRLESLGKTTMGSHSYKMQQAKIHELDEWIEENRRAAMRGLAEAIAVKETPKS